MKIYETSFREKLIEKVVPKLRIRKIPIKNIYIKEYEKIEGSAIIVANHTNSHDIPTLESYVTDKFRILVQDTKDLDLISRIYLSSIGAAFVDISENANNAKLFSLVENTLSSNSSMNKIGLFPEGVFNFSNHLFTNECRSGAARFAINNNAPVIPIMMEFENFLCYLNQGQPLYFFSQSTKKAEIDFKIINLMKNNDIVIVKDCKANYETLYSNNECINSIDDINDNYEDIVNNNVNLKISYVYTNINEYQATEVIRDHLTTMKWYLYESFGIRKNNEKLRVDFESNLQATKDDYPALDYEEAKKRIFSKYVTQEEVFSILDSIEPLDKESYALVNSIKRVRK